MGKIKKITLTLITTCLLLSGCTKLNIKSNPNQPAFSNEFKQLNETILTANYSKSNLTLVAPKSGDNQLVINKFTDKLKRTFAVVFYKSNFQQKSLRMLILQKSKKNSWKQLSNTPCHGYDVDKIMFTQTKDSDDIYLIVGYCVSAKNMVLNPLKSAPESKYFFIYKFNPDNMRTTKKTNENNSFKKGCVCIYPYETMELFKLDNSNEKILASLSETENKPNQSKTQLELNIFSLSELNKLKKDSYLNLTHCSTNNEYEIKLDKKSFNKPALFLDFKSHYYNETNIVLIQKTKKGFNFEKIYKNSENNLNNFSFDFDNDGCIEIPTAEPFPGYTIINNTIVPKKEESTSNPQVNNNHLMVTKSPKTSKLPQITNWIKFSSKNNKIQQKIIPTYTNFTKGYGIYLPINWQKKVSACYTQKNKSIEFFEFDKNINNNKNKILTLSTCPKDSKLPSGFFVLKTCGPFCYIAKLHNSASIKNKELLISENTLKQSFFLLKNNINSNSKESEQN